MNEYTRELLNLAYRTCRSRRKSERQRNQDISLSELVHQMWNHWATYRDGTIHRWAAHILTQGDEMQLAARWEQVDDLLREIDEFWEPPDGEDHAAEWTAMGIAGLYWVHLEAAGRVPVPQYVEKEMAAWLAERQRRPVQLELF